MLIRTNKLKNKGISCFQSLSSVLIMLINVKKPTSVGLLTLMTMMNLQWATLVTHRFWRAHIFSQKCWNRTFSMIIYLLTFYLFDNIKKSIGITHVNYSGTPKSILTNVHDCTCILNVYIFYLRFALGIIHGDRCYRKTPKTIILFK